MTFGKTALLAACFVGAVGLGIGIGMSVRSQATVPGFDAYMSAPPSPGGDEFARPAATAQAGKADAPVTSAAAATPRSSAVTPSTPELQARLKPLFNRGTDMKRAADGFKDAHQFATIAHAAHNTQVPFMLLKHRVLVEGKSLVTAIRASKPELDEAAEAARAREAAAADLADIQV